MAISAGTAVVGNNGQRAGVYVYSRSDVGLWTESVELRAGEYSIGAAVAISDSTVVVGDPFTNTAYVFTRDARGAWSREATLLAGDGAAGDAFGSAVAVSGDTAVVGAMHDDDAGASSGSAYVFTRDAEGRWTEQAKLLANDGAATDYFGGSVALDGDTVLVGAPSILRSVPAYVYVRHANGIWSAAARLAPDEGAAGRRFGASVALDGDSALIGSPLSAENGTNSGSAHVYVRDARGSWSKQTKLLPSEGAAHLLFGLSVSLSGDTALITTDNRPAYVFTRESAEWSERLKLYPDDFGEFYGIAGAVTGDTAMVGAIGDDDNGQDSGSVFVFELNMASAALHCPGDLNGDESAELVLVTPEGRVLVKDVNARMLANFGGGSSRDIIDSELVPDLEADGTADLALLDSSGTVEIRDLLTGAIVSSVAFQAGAAPSHLAVLSSHDGSGVAKLAVIGRDSAVMQVREALSGQLVNEVESAGYVLPRDLDVLPDATGNGWPELAVLGENRRREHADKIEIRDPWTGEDVREIWLGTGWRVYQQTLLTDINANGAPDMAVLRSHGTTNRLNLLVRDTSTAEWLNYIGFPREMTPKKLVSLMDLNGNGSDEVAVFGPRFSGQAVMIKDSLTREKLNEIWFDRRFSGQDLRGCGDLNANGAEEVAFLGHRARDDRYKVVLKDSRSGERLAIVWF